MTSNEEFKDLAEFVIKYGKSLGADQIEAYTLFGSVKSVQIERGSIRRFTDTNNSGLGVRVIKNKAIGMASTTIFTKESLEKTVKDAYTLASVIPSDPNFKTLPSDTTEAPTISGRYDKDIAEISVEDFTELILEAIQEATIREDAIVNGNFNAGIGERYIINSEGIDRFASQTSVSGYLGVKIQDGEDIGKAYYYDAATLMKNFKYIKIGKEAGIRAKKMLGSKKIDTASLPILLDPDSTYGTIEPILSSGINAFSVFNKTAFFVDKIGDSIASDKLSIVDDPFVPEGTDSAAFDDEGVVPKKLSLVENGILQTYITDSYTAPLVGLENTGHASRGSFASRPRPAPYTMKIKAGTVSKDELLTDMKEGIYLMSSSIHSSGNNPQVSAQIDQGFYVKDGELLYPVKNTVIGCTIFELFNKIEDMSKETEDRSGHEAPWMLLSPLQVSGGK